MTVIGIAACRKLEDYRQSILHVGGEPRVLETSMTVEQALAGIDGLMLTGGGDVAPSRYGETPHATVEAAEPGRDEFEIALITAARARNLPIFAICRGVQILNVACGGTLVQDIPSEVTGALAHSLPVPQHHTIGARDLGRPGLAARRLIASGWSRRALR
jgi:putative glutamine amidotransferase